MTDDAAWLLAVKSVTAPFVFNPYNSLCPVYDLPDAAAVRLSMLTDVLSRAMQTGVDSMWIGRDLGYRGGRRTGLALTDELHLRSHLSRWGVRHPPVFLKGRAVAERTASVVWNELDSLQRPVFLWNVFPFHPHMPHEPLSNRAHSSGEREVGEGLLAWLVKILQPKLLVAIGQNAYTAAVRCAPSVEIRAVRHPSYGGQSDFISGLRRLYVTTH